MRNITLIGSIVAVLTGLPTESTAAQRVRANRSVLNSTARLPPFGSPRLPQTPDAGIIRWNSPNKDGNLGGSGTGGSGGGGG
jgi:hypothetical protein